MGIVGRTGAGKSSIISALFRFALNEGFIIIDNIEIHGLALDDLRSKLSIISQEPILFSGTMRKNLDPFDEYPDRVLWNALDEVHFYFKILLKYNFIRYHIVMKIIIITYLVTIKKYCRKFSGWFELNGVRRGCKFQCRSKAINMFGSGNCAK